jgi:hypothetical protein
LGPKKLARGRPSGGMFVEARLEHLAEHNRQTLNRLKKGARTDVAAELGGLHSLVYFDDDGDDTVPLDFEFLGTVKFNATTGALSDGPRSVFRKQIIPALERGEDWSGLEMSEDSLEIIQGLLLKDCLQELRPDCYYKACTQMLSKKMHLQSYCWLPKSLRQCLSEYQKSSRSSIAFERFVLLLCKEPQCISISKEYVNAHLKLFQMEDS